MLVVVLVLAGRRIVPSTLAGRSLHSILAVSTVLVVMVPVVLGLPTMLVPAVLVRQGRTLRLEPHPAGRFPGQRRVPLE